MFDFELLAKLLDHFPIQIISIIYNKFSWYAVAANDVLFQESSHHGLGDAFVGSGFHTVGKVIDGHQDTLMSIWGFGITGPMTSIPQPEKCYDIAYTCRVTTAPKVHDGKQILLNIIS